MKKSFVSQVLESTSPPGPYSGSRLTERRHEAMLTQEQLAELVGVSKQTIGFWEQRRRYPTLTHVAQLQEVLYEEVRRVRAREQALRRLLEARRKRQAAQEGVETRQILAQEAPPHHYGSAPCQD